MNAMINIKHPDSIGLSNAGKKWTDEEQNKLLEELNKNIDINLISQSHNRTSGSINARCKLIAYNMYTNDISIEEICQITKLKDVEVMDAIKQMENKHKKRDMKKNKKKILINVQDNSSTNKNINTDDDITEIKKDIIEIKNNIKELVAMMKALYEFEHS